MDQARFDVLSTELELHVKVQYKWLTKPGHSGKAGMRCTFAIRTTTSTSAEEIVRISRESGKKSTAYQLALKASLHLLLSIPKVRHVRGRGPCMLGLEHAGCMSMYCLAAMPD